MRKWGYGGYDGDVQQVAPSEIRRGDLIFLGYRWCVRNLDWTTVKGITVTNHNVYQFECETLDNQGRRSTHTLPYRESDRVPRKRRRKTPSRPKRLAGWSPITNAGHQPTAKTFVGLSGFASGLRCSGRGGKSKSPINRLAVACAAVNAGNSDATEADRDYPRPSNIGVDLRLDRRDAIQGAAQFRKQNPRLDRGHKLSKQT